MFGVEPPTDLGSQPVATFHVRRIIYNPTYTYTLIHTHTHTYSPLLFRIVKKSYYITTIKHLKSKARVLNHLFSKRRIIPEKYVYFQSQYMTVQMYCAMKLSKVSS